MNIFRNDIIKNVALFPVNDGLIKTEQLPNIFAKVEFYVSYISFLSYLDLKIWKKYENGPKYSNMKTKRSLAGCWITKNMYN